MVQVFGRYDRSASVIARGDSAPWNYRQDGKLLILGIQRTLSPTARIAFDYQSNIPDDVNKRTTDMFFVHAHFRF